MSTATRQDVRQAVALATELNLFSVTLHGVTWTLYHPERQPRPGPQSANRDKGKNAATFIRDSAQRFRLAHVFHRWKQLNQMQSPDAATRTHLRRSRQGCRDAGSSGAATQQQQSRWRSERCRRRQSPAIRPRRRVRNAFCSSTGPPPPSLPPSPPSPNGGKQPPGPSGPKQTGRFVSCPKGGDRKMRLRRRLRHTFEEGWRCPRHL